jgi:hypothetical protein
VPPCLPKALLSCRRGDRNGLRSAGWETRIGAKVPSGGQREGRTFVHDRRSAPRWPGFLRSADVSTAKTGDLRARSVVVSTARNPFSGRCSLMNQKAGAPCRCCPAPKPSAPVLPRLGHSGPRVDAGSMAVRPRQNAQPGDGAPTTPAVTMGYESNSPDALSVLGRPRSRARVRQPPSVLATGRTRGGRLPKVS